MRAQIRAWLTHPPPYFSTILSLTLFPTINLLHCPRLSWQQGEEESPVLSGNDIPHATRSPLSNIFLPSNCYMALLYMLSHPKFKYLHHSSRSGGINFLNWKLRTHQCHPRRAFILDLMVSCTLWLVHFTSGYFQNESRDLPSPSPNCLEDKENHRHRIQVKDVQCQISRSKLMANKVPMGLLDKDEQGRRTRYRSKMI